MKTAFLTGIVVLTGSLAFAKNAKPAGPCAQITQACRKAGFTKGDAKDGKGLYKDCVNPIVNGKTVSGVSVDPALPGQCKAKRAAKKAKPAGGTGQKQ